MSEAVERDIIRIRPCGADIAKRVAAEHGLTWEQIVGPDRHHHIAHVRQEAMWVVRHNTALSLHQIGRIFKRDHTTIHTGVVAHERRLEAGQ